MPSTIRIAFFVVLLTTVGFVESIQAEDRQWYRLGPESSIFTGIAVDPTTPQIVYAIGRPLNGTGGLYKSTDGGNSWTQIKSSVGDVSLAVNPASPQTIYAGTDKSTDGGNSWSRFAGTGWSPTALAIDFQNPQIVYASTDFYNINGMSQKPGIFRSTNGGSDWSNVLTIYEKFCSLAIDPVSPQTIYAGTIRTLYKSTDGGAS